MNLDEIIKLPAVYKHYKKYNWVKDLTRAVEVEQHLIEDEDLKEVSK